LLLQEHLRAFFLAEPKKSSTFAARETTKTNKQRKEKTKQNDLESKQRVHEPR
jgi:hypothetical protein